LTRDILRISYRIDARIDFQNPTSTISNTKRIIIAKLYKPRQL